LISGNGDGAVSDVLRALIIDYKPDELLSEILGAEFIELLSNSYNVTKKSDQMMLIVCRFAWIIL